MDVKPMTFYPLTANMLLHLYKKKMNDISGPGCLHDQQIVCSRNGKRPKKADENFQYDFNSSTNFIL